TASAAHPASATAPRSSMRPWRSPAGSADADRPCGRAGGPPPARTRRWGAPGRSAPPCRSLSGLSPGSAVDPALHQRGVVGILEPGLDAGGLVALVLA